MRIFGVLFMSVLLISCSDNNGRSVTDSIPLDDVFTLELSFGYKNLPAGYLLARPAGKGIDVRSNGDILVVDENWVKVFDAQGNPRTMFGGPGQGPGEIAGHPSMHVIGVGPDDRIAVLDERGISFFNTDMTFDYLYRVRGHPKYKEEDFFLKTLFFGVKRIHPYQPSKWVSLLSNRIIAENYRGQRIILLETDETYTEIARHIEKSGIFYENFGTSVPWRGNMCLGVCEDDWLVYYIPADIYDIVPKPAEYTLHVVSLDNPKMKSEIAKRYVPAAIPDTIKQEKLTTERESFKHSYAAIRPLLENDRYYDPVQALLTDRNFAFVVTNTQNEESEFLVDVFDISRNIYIQSAYISQIPDLIKNGYAYRIGKTEAGFSVIEKYRIDPAVYGKE